jgi:hypothetical protein
MFSLLVPCLLAIAGAPAFPVLKPVQPNTNVQAAGHLDGSVLTVRLFADVGAWHPQGPRGPALDVAAFGEEGGDLAPRHAARRGHRGGPARRRGAGSHIRDLDSRRSPSRGRRLVTRRGLHDQRLVVAEHRAAAGEPVEITIVNRLTEATSTRPGTLWPEIRRGTGEWVLQVPLEIR